MSIDCDSKYADIILTEKERYKNVPRQTIEAIQKGFRQHAAQKGKGTIDLMGVAKLLEALGDPKHMSEVRQLIASVDTDKDGKITFLEFVQMQFLPKEEAPVPEPLDSALNKASAAPKKALSDRAKMFDDAANAVAFNQTAANKAAIEAKVKETKHINAVKKGETEREEREAREKEEAKIDSKARLAARAATFAAK